MLHNAVSGVHGISSALHSILFLLTSDSFERESFESKMDAAIKKQIVSFLQRGHLRLPQNCLEISWIPLMTALQVN